jgi:tricarballylate dehydrogenase
MARSVTGSLSRFNEVDVAVVGGGNAALCAALAASDAGASVIVLERDTREMRGGNSKYTRNIRCAHEGWPPRVDPYPDEELLDDLARVTGKDLDMGMARFAISESRTALKWMEAHGINWQPALHGTLGLARTNQFFLGGGKALLNAYYRLAEQRGISIEYGALVEEVEIRDQRVERLIVRHEGETITLRPKATIIASGGFEANIEWLKRYWGPGADNYIVRGSSANDGRVLASLLSQGVMERGNGRSFHAVAVDARSPKYDGGIVTRVDSIPFSIVVNQAGERFYDEGEDAWPKRYAMWGRLVAQQPDQIAYSIFDSKAFGRFIPAMNPPIVAPTIQELAVGVGLDPASLKRTVDQFNVHTGARDGYDPTRPDGVKTSGLEPPKSNWALPVDRAPFAAYTLRPGITFTYLGVAVDTQAQVLLASGTPVSGLYAAGEIMAGNILLNGYLAGFGMTIGTVFGRIAGREAARHVRAS